MVQKVEKTDREWKEALSPDQYCVLRKARTERAFTGKYNNHYENRQGPDFGTQYRSVIFYHNETQRRAALKKIEELQELKRFAKPIATQVAPVEEFYEAEEYHQQYYEKLKKLR